MLNKSNILTTVLALLITLNSPQSSANLIKNGSFDTCNYNHWQQEIDFASAPSNTSEFKQSPQTNGCQAVLRSDYNDTSTSELVSLSQSFQFNSGLDYKLSFDLAATTDAISFGQNINEDHFESVNIGLAQNGIFYNENASLGPLIKNWVISENKSATRFIFNLSADDFIAINKDSWSLVFLLQRGKVNGSVSDNAGSSLLIDNVSLTANSLVTVNEPKPLGIFVASLIIMVLAQKRSRSKK